jgi:hypothetical protein
MIERDRELLARLAQINQGIGEVVVKLMGGQDGGELPAAGLRDLGLRLAALGVDLLKRAAERDGNPVARVIIDAQPT